MLELTQAPSWATGSNATVWGAVELSVNWPQGAWNRHKLAKVARYDYTYKSEGLLSCEDAATSINVSVRTKHPQNPDWKELSTQRVRLDAANASCEAKQYACEVFRDATPCQSDPQLTSFDGFALTSTSNTLWFALPADAERTAEAFKLQLVFTRAPELGRSTWAKVAHMPKEPTSLAIYQDADGNGVCGPVHPAYDISQHGADGSAAPLLEGAPSPGSATTPADPRATFITLGRFAAAQAPVYVVPPHTRARAHLFQCCVVRETCLRVRSRGCS